MHEHCMISSMSCAALPFCSVTAAHLRAGDAMHVPVHEGADGQAAPALLVALPEELPASSRPTHARWTGVGSARWLMSAAFSATCVNKGR